MEKLASVWIVAWGGASLWVVDAAAAKAAKPRRTDFHAHHAIQVTLSLGGAFSLSTSDAHMRSDAIAVAADTPHLFDAEGLVAHLFVDPESRAGLAVARRFLGGADMAALPVEILSGLRERIAAAYRAPARNNTALIGLGRELVSTLGAGVFTETPDPRICRVIAWAAEQIDAPISLSDALAVGGLSASRLRHLFVEQTGLPFKTYLLWLRLTRAVECFAAGASLTQVAHQAGFADSAHFSRTFRRMFGITPGALRLL